MESKENKILDLFFNYPSKYWHFKDIKKETKMADSKISNWLKKLQKEKIILKNKKQKMILMNKFNIALGKLYTIFEDKRPCFFQPIEIFFNDSCIMILFIISHFPCYSVYLSGKSILFF